MTSRTFTFGIGTGTGRYVVEASSMAQVARAFADADIAGYTPYYLKRMGCETGNDHEIAISRMEPGTVFVLVEGEWASVRAWKSMRSGKRWTTVEKVVVEEVPLTASSTFTVAANGSIHRDGCKHTYAVKVLSDGWVSVEKALDIAYGDFDTPRIAPCAKETY